MGNDDPELNDEEFERYARHLVLPEVGDEGQLKLRAARVLIVGAGGLGSPLALYLAAAGIGTIGLLDDDVVDLSNLQRQVLHGQSDIGSHKVASGMRRLAEINPHVKVIPHETRLTADNAGQIVSAYDLVADGTDNFATRFLVNDACYLAGRTLVSAAILRFDGQLSVFKAHLRAADAPVSLPCYRCVFGDQPPDSRDSCADVGVLGALAGTMGALQSVEVIKEILGIGESLAGSLLLYDALATTFRKIALQADPGCPLCGPEASIRTLADVDYGSGNLCST